MRGDRAIPEKTVDSRLCAVHVCAKREAISWSVIWSLRGAVASLVQRPIEQNEAPAHPVRASSTTRLLATSCAEEKPSPLSRPGWLRIRERVRQRVQAYSRHGAEAVLIMRCGAFWCGPGTLLRGSGLRAWPQGSACAFRLRPYVRRGWRRLRRRRGFAWRR